MYLGIDIRSLQERWPGGITSYTRELLTALVPYIADDSVLLFSSGWGAHLRQQTPFARLQNVRDVHLRVPNKLFNSSIAFFHRPTLDALLGKLDLFFAPNFPFVNVSDRCRLVVTVHDLSFVHFSHLLSPRMKLWYRCTRPQKVFERADKLIAISHATKRDLMETYGFPDTKIDVVYSGAPAEPFAKMPEKQAKSMCASLGIARPFFLILGALEPRKNLSTVVEAYRRLPKRIRESFDLVIAGASVWQQDGLLSTSLVSLEGIHKVGYVSPEQKIALFRAASCFIFPSLYEGFGFPLLEAMSAGTPIIASNVSSIPEITEDAAILCDPNDVDAFVSAVTQLVESESLRASLVEKGAKRVMDFSWSQAAEKTHNIFASLL